MYKRQDVTRDVVVVVAVAAVAARARRAARASGVVENVVI